MIRFFKTRVGLACVGGFMLLMAFAAHRVTVQRRERERRERVPAVAAVAPPAIPAVRPPAPSEVSPMSAAGTDDIGYLGRYLAQGRSTRVDVDRNGNAVTRRKTAVLPDAVGTPPVPDEPALALPPSRAGLRLRGTPRPPGGVRDEPPRPPLASVAGAGSPASVVAAAPTANRAAALPPEEPRRFTPYGRVVKCELVFTIDSTNEQTPLVGLVMEPVYNNGLLVIPAGAELHGIARPDRLRDRIFSGNDWVLVFPRDGVRPNGRQLNVRGVALQRREPDANGMTWGVTDGSYGLEGQVLRTLDQAEIRRFAATFLAAGAVALQSRQQTGRSGVESVRNTPQNAILQGSAATLQQYADLVGAEIETHGVFLRVPAGHQFYFYPMQIIDADLAGISSDVATVK